MIQYMVLSLTLNFTNIDGLVLRYHSGRVMKCFRTAYIGNNIIISNTVSVLLRTEHNIKKNSFFLNKTNFLSSFFDQFHRRLDHFSN